MFKREVSKLRGMAARVSENVSRMRQLREQVEDHVHEIRKAALRAHNG